MTTARCGPGRHACSVGSHTGVSTREVEHVIPRVEGPAFTLKNAISVRTCSRFPLTCRHFANLKLRFDIRIVRYVPEQLRSMRLHRCLESLELVEVQPADSRERRR